MSAPVVLRLSDIHVEYPAPDGGRRVVHAVRGVSLTVHEGETVALVGESGCGKSSLARAALMLHPPASGHVELRSAQGPLFLETLRGRALRRARRFIQVVFQDPYASLDPRRTVGDAVGEPLRAFRLARGAQRVRRVASLLERVGLPSDFATRYPHELSGGQRQRIGIARALAPTPRVLVLDEAVSALDVSLRAQILNLLLDIRAEQALAMLFITHDLAVVHALADRVAVMYLGSIMEIGPRDLVLNHPLHPYTQALLAAVPTPDPTRRRTHQDPLPGDPPPPDQPIRGCPFAGRCPLVEPRCLERTPELRVLQGGVAVACHLVR